MPIVALLFIFWPQDFRAQEVSTVRAGANSLRGIVTDTLGSPLSDIDVVISELRRRTRTRIDGTFRFDSVAPGTYNVMARSVGYLAPTHRVEVGAQGGSVSIRMIRFSYVLQSQVVQAARGGLSGIIGDTTFRAMADVKISVVGASSFAITDSSGAFFVPLRPGSYLLKIERTGFTRQTVGVTIPENEGRWITTWMVPQSGPPDHIASQSLFDLGQRMLRVSSASSHFFSREDLERLEIQDLQALARRWANGSISVDCQVSIGGRRSSSVPLGELKTSDIEFVELYLPSKVGTNPVRGPSMSGGRRRFTPTVGGRPAPIPACGNLAITAWLRN